MEFSEKIRSARTARGMSQKTLARESGISLRTIQNYELGARMPKKRSSYTQLACALGINTDALLDEDVSFVLRASEQYGKRGAQQALSMVSDIAAMWAGGDMEEDDMDMIMQAMQEAYWEAKKNNRKYVNKRYMKDGESDEI